MQRAEHAVHGEHINPTTHGAALRYFRGLPHDNHSQVHPQRARQFLEAVWHPDLFREREISLMCQCFMARSPSIKQVTKHAEFPQTQDIDKVVDMPVVMQRMVLRIQTGLKSRRRSSSAELFDFF